MYHVFNQFKDAEMADGRPLFREESARHKNGMGHVFGKVMEHVLKGCVSDSPDVDMFIQIGHCSDGLPVYRCFRGTSQLEVRGWAP